MRTVINKLLIIFIACLWTLPQSIASENYPQVEMVTSSGTFVLELDRNRAPVTVENFLNYVKEGFYKDTIFHRVIEGFVIQAGGYTKDFEEKETKPEIINESGNGLINQRMSIGMARNNLPHTGSSQFYINLVNNYSLDPMPTRWGYAVFGDVIDGMDVVDAIGHSATELNQGFQDVPVAPIIILEARIIGE
ncbi:MAG TPA: peptidylprolyl isomerase [Gammaproteobacteria bacterium]|nr:peptidylprolyl isomerase [Gammaproteobacteria bacterium]